jgi:hypothetical protein
LSRIKERAEAQEERGRESDPIHQGDKHDPDASGN